MIDVSVVIPTRDRIGMLCEALRSVLAQRGVHVEAIVVDDGSRDGTAAEVASLGVGRVRVLRNASAEGVSAARNRGIAAAVGRWIAFLDDDDIWAPDKLALQLDAAERTGCGWAFGGSVTVTTSLRISGGTVPPGAAATVEQLPMRNVVPAGASNVVVRRDVLAAVGEFDCRLRHMADWEMWMRLARSGPPAVVPRPVLAYRLHEGNASAHASGMSVRAIDRELAVVEECAARAGVPPRVDRAAVFRWVAWHCLLANRRREAMRAYGRAAAAGDGGAAARMAMSLCGPVVPRRWLPYRDRDPDWERLASAWLGGVSE